MAFPLIDSVLEIINTPPTTRKIPAQTPAGGLSPNKVIAQNAPKKALTLETELDPATPIW
jgi:hypothetical protein